MLRSENFVKFIQSIAPVSFSGDMRDTPRRVEAAYKELLSGLLSPPPKMTTFKQKVDQLIVVQDLPFHSLCSHHFMMFFGKAHIGYLPNKLVLGLSKFPRALNYFAHRPQMQERLTEEVADFLQKHLHAKFLIVVIEATHLCASARGVQAPGHLFKTSAIRGSKNEALRQEFFSILSR